jgi:hypothetical protein
MQDGPQISIRQPDGSRKRYREFSFATKAEATQALAVLRTNGWKTRYALKPAEQQTDTTIKQTSD